MATVPPLPEPVTRFVGLPVAWQEDRPFVVGEEAVLLPTEDICLVLGARWARNVDGKPFGQTVGLVQYLVERSDNTSRWSPPMDVPS